MDTLIIGASNNPERYSYKALQMLREYDHKVYALGHRIVEVDGIEIKKDFPKVENLDTITLYINPSLQKQYYNEILNSGCRRVIANPGTENNELKKLCEEKGIIYQEACTLVLLRTHQY